MPCPQFASIMPATVSLSPQTLRLHANLAQPFLGGSRDKFAAIIGPDIRWLSTRDEQFRQSRQHVFVAELSCNDERQASLLANPLHRRVRRAWWSAQQLADQGRLPGDHSEQHLRGAGGEPSAMLPVE